MFLSKICPSKIQNGLKVISALGNKGEIVEVVPAPKAKAFWIKIIWENGKTSSGPWNDGGRDLWYQVKIDEDEMAFS